MVVVNEENGVCGVECVEFFPCIKICVAFCLCETFKGFSIKYTSIIWSSIDKVVCGGPSLDHTIIDG